MNLTPAKSRPGDDGTLCSICLDTLNHCVFTPLTKEALINEGLYLPSSPGGPEDWDVPICCGCTFHHRCVTYYIRSKLEDRSSLFLPGKTQRGLVCPNKCRIAPANEVYAFSEAEVLDIQQQGLAHKSSNGLTEDEVDKLMRWVFHCEEETVTTVSETVDPLLLATTKACPQCGFRASHPHGHGCHHISPYGGCRNCKGHFCYNCLSCQDENQLVRGHAAHCRCGFWSNFCQPIKNLDDIRNFLELSPYPQDNRCGCVICSDCRKGNPCSECHEGDCAVCRGLIPHGPLSLEDIPRFKEELQVMSERYKVDDLFEALVEACRYSNWGFFESLGRDKELPTAAKDEVGNTLLHYAAQNTTFNSHRILKFLLSLRPIEVLEANNMGFTPLHHVLVALATLINRSKRATLNMQEQLISQQELVIKMFNMAPYEAVARMEIEGLPVVDWALKDEKRLVCLLRAFPGAPWWDQEGRSLLYCLLDRHLWDLSNEYLDAVSAAGTEQYVGVNLTYLSRPLLALIAEALQQHYTTPKSNLRERLLAIAQRQWSTIDEHGRTTLQANLCYLLDKTPASSSAPGLLSEAQDSGKTHLVNGLVNLAICLCEGALRLSDSDRTTYLLHRDCEGNTALHLCAQRSQLWPEPFSQLVRAYPESLHVTNNKGDMPLHLLTANWRSPSCWDFLLKLDIDLRFHTLNKTRDSPFLSLCGLDEPRTRSRSIISVDSDGGSSMSATESLLRDVMCYVFFGREDSSVIPPHRKQQLQLQLAQSDSQRRTALHKLVSAGHFEVLKYLIDAAKAVGVVLPLAMRDNNGNSVLHLLCELEREGQLILKVANACRVGSACAPKGWQGRSALYWLLTSRNNEGLTVFDLLAVHGITSRRQNASVDIAKKLADIVFAESERQCLNPLLFTEHSAVEPFVNALCRSPSRDAHTLLIQWFEQGIITVPHSLPRSTADQRTALQLLFVNIHARKRLNFQSLVVRVLDFVVAAGRAESALSRTDGDGKTLLHYIAAERDFFALRHLIDRNAVSPELCAKRNNADVTVLHIMLCNHGRLGPPEKRARERAYSTTSNASSSSHRTDNSAYSEFSDHSEISENFDELHRYVATDSEYLEVPDETDLGGVDLIDLQVQMHATECEEDDEPIIMDILAICEGKMAEFLEVRDSNHLSLLQLALRHHYVAAASFLFDRWLALIPPNRHKVVCDSVYIGHDSLVKWLCLHSHFFPLFDKLVDREVLIFRPDDVFRLAVEPDFDFNPDDDMKDDQPLLHWLCCCDDGPRYAMIRMMLCCHFLSIDTVDATNRNPVHIACEADDDVLLRVLLENANMNNSELCGVLSQMNDDGEIPLTVARNFESIKACAYLEPIMRALGVPLQDDDETLGMD